MVFGVPRSKLPHSIPEIKEAIIEVALDSLDEPQFVEKLRAGYMMLATFIDDEAAASCEKARLSMNAAREKNRPDYAEFAMASEEITADDTQDTILQEMRKNRVVFNEMLKKLKAKIN